MLNASPQPMAPFFFRTFLAAAAVVLLPLLAMAAANPPSLAEETHADQAIQAYVKKQRAEQEKASDQLVAGKVAALLRDPASPIIGNPNGDVAVIEFFDYACPFCKAVEPRVEKLVRDDKGVKLILKEFPILTPESLVASKAALAAAKQGKYEAFHNALIGFKGRLQNEVIFDTARTVGLDVARLRKDMDSPDVSDEIIANFNLARGLRIFQTPGFIVGGHILTEPSAEIDFPRTVAAARNK
jgi:protein-disulfide isomerase